MKSDDDQWSISGEVSISLLPDLPPIEICDALPGDAVLLMPNVNPGELSPQQMIEQKQAVALRLSDHLHVWSGGYCLRCRGG